MMQKNTFTKDTKSVNFLKRYFALLIDFLIIGVIFISILLLLVIISTKVTNVVNFNDLYSDMVLALIVQSTGFIVTSLYFIVLHTKYNTTIGKRILKLRLRSLENKEISALKVTIRFLLLIFTCAFFGIDFIFYLFSKRNLFLHDWLTKTYVE